MNRHVLRPFTYGLDAVNRLEVDHNFDELYSMVERLQAQVYAP